MKSDAIYSEFGDLRLFFQHEDVRDDFADRPEWSQCVQAMPENFPDITNLADWPEDDEEAEKWLNYSVENYQC